MDPSIVNALLESLSRDEANVALRLHLVDVMIQSKRYAEALDHVSVVLGRQPDNVDALNKGAVAAEGAGDLIRAAGYRNLANALGMSQAKQLLDGMVEPEEPRPVSEPLRQTYQSDDLVTIEDNTEDDFFASVMERPEITLSDVAGMEAVKRRLDLSFLGPLRNPDIRKLYGKSLRGGLLLYGPPGCGKTYIARAMAGELGARFASIGLTDVVDMYIGESERKLHELFQSARRHAPCVVFIDEIDALGHKRSNLKGSAGRNIVNQLLSELDGADKENEGVFVLAATNHPWDLDSALRRPGRIDRAVLVLPPDEPARRRMFEIFLEGRPTEGVDLDWLAKSTDGFSGADVAHVVESAAELAIESSLHTGIVRPISNSDLKSSLKGVTPSTRSWFETAKNYALYANEGGAYDELADYLRRLRII